MSVRTAVADVIPVAISAVIPAILVVLVVSGVGVILVLNIELGSTPRFILGLDTGLGLDVISLDIVGWDTTFIDEVGFGLINWDIGVDTG